MNPEQRDDLYTHPDAGVIYNPDREQFLVPNATAGRVLALCDGTRSVDELLEQIPRETGLPPEREWAIYSLDRLRRRGLLKHAAGIPRNDLTRRAALRRLRVVGLAALLPAVQMIAAPTPAAAGSKLPAGAPCQDSAQCASGNCAGVCL